MNCKYCGAPLKPDEEKCPYCGGVVNDDLTGENLSKNYKSTAKIKYASLTFVIILNIITLGYYSVYWLFSRKKSLSSMSKTERFPETELWIMITSMIFSILVGFDSSFYGLFALVTSITSILINFLIRRILRSYALKYIDREAMQNFVAPSGVMLFFFGTIYLQSQINKMIQIKLLQPVI